jgi:hypothetical protein
MSDDHHHVPAEFKPKNGDKVRPSEDALRAELAMSAPLTGAAVARSRRAPLVNWTWQKACPC